MTIGEIKKMYEGKYAGVELYNPTTHGRYYPTDFHSDHVTDPIIGDYPEDAECGLWELLSEEEYNDSVMANVSDSADFEGWFGDKNAKILCLMLTDSESDRRENLIEIASYMTEEMKLKKKEITEKLMKEKNLTERQATAVYTALFSTDNKNVEFDKILEWLDNGTFNQSNTQRGLEAMFKEERTPNIKFSCRRDGSEVCWLTLDDEMYAVEINSLNELSEDEIAEELH